MLIPDKLDELMEGLVQLKHDTDAEGAPMIPPGVLAFTEEGFYSLDLVELLDDINDLCEAQGVSPVPVAAKMAVMTLRHHIPDAKITGVALGSEAVMMVKPIDFDLTSIKRGDIQRDWRENPASEAVECLVMTVVEDDLCGGWNVAVCSKQFRRGDAGVIQWSDTLTSSDIDISSSFAADMLRTAVTDDPSEVAEFIDFIDMTGGEP